MIEHWRGWILIIEQPRQKPRTIIYDYDQADDVNKRADAARAAGGTVSIFAAEQRPSAHKDE